MGTLYLAALRTGIRRWPIVVVLFLTYLAAGLLFTAATWLWLSSALDASLATRTLLTDLDMNAFVDLFVYHGDSLRMLLIAGALTALAFALLGVWLNATAVVASATDAPLSECLQRGFGLFPAYVQLWALTNALNAGSIAAAFLMARGLTRWTVESADEMTYYWIVAGSVIIGAGLLFFFTTIHDHARVRAAVTGAGAPRAYAWGVAFVARREWRALLLAALLLGTGFVVWVVYQTVGMLIVTRSASGVTLSLIWGEAFLVGRAWLRVGSFAAAIELQNARQREA